MPRLSYDDYIEIISGRCTDHMVMYRGYVRAICGLYRRCVRIIQ